MEQVPKEFTIRRLTMDPFRFDSTRLSDPWKKVLMLPKHAPKKPIQIEAPQGADKAHSGRKHPSSLVIIGSFVIVVLLIALWFIFNFRY